MLTSDFVCPCSIGFPPPTEVRFPSTPPGCPPLWLGQSRSSSQALPLLSPESTSEAVLGSLVVSSGRASGFRRLGVINRESTGGADDLVWRCNAVSDRAASPGPCPRPRPSSIASCAPSASRPSLVFTKGLRRFGFGDHQKNHRVLIYSANSVFFGVYEHHREALAKRSARNHAQIRFSSRSGDW